MVHSRSTERLDIAITFATSATLRPPKNRNSIILAWRGSSFLELGQGIFKRQQVDVATGLADQIVVKCDAMPIAIPLCRLMPPRMVHEDLSHGMGGNGQEMGTALPIDTPWSGKLQIDFVDQRGRLKRMALSFPAQVPRGERSHFGVNVGER